MREAKRSRKLQNSAPSIDFVDELSTSALSFRTPTELPGSAPEPFVDANTAAAFLCLRPRRVLELARQGAVPAHPLGDGQRKVWRFRLSELAAAMCSRAVNYIRQSPAPKEIQNGAW
jgi:hypothetical protein